MIQTPFHVPERGPVPHQLEIVAKNRRASSDLFRDRVATVNAVRLTGEQRDHRTAGKNIALAAARQNASKIHDSWNNIKHRRQRIGLSIHAKAVGIADDQRSANAAFRRRSSKFDRGVIEAPAQRGPYSE